CGKSRSISSSSARRLLRAMLIASAIVLFFGNRRSRDASPIRVRSRLTTSSMSERSSMVKLGLRPIGAPIRRNTLLAKEGKVPPATSHQLLGATQHLLRRAAGERQQQDRTWLHAALDQPRDAIDQRASLARSRSRYDQQRAFAMRHGGLLGG